MRVVVPFDAADPKTRLSPVLDAGERAAFARAMLDDVCEAVRAAGGSPLVVATAPIDHECPVRVDDAPLSTAVNRAITDVRTDADACAVLMADCALATSTAVRGLGVGGPDDRPEATITLVPGRGGGTNGLVVRDGDFAVDFHGASIRDHRAAAAAIGATVREVDSYRLGTDVDAPADLAEVLLHGRGQAADWLADRFVLDPAADPVGVERRAAA
jgi:2-phospho-L-lactate guanylyltransferase